MMNRRLATWLLILAIGLICSTEFARGQVGGKLDSLIYQHDIRDFRVKHADVDSVANLLNEQFPDARFTGDDETGYVYARVSEESAEVIKRFVEVLDQRAAQTNDERAAKEQQALERKRAQERDSLIDSLTHKLNVLTRSYGPDHPSVKTVENEIQMVQGKARGRANSFAAATPDRGGEDNRSDAEQRTLDLAKELRREVAGNEISGERLETLTRRLEAAVEDAFRVRLAQQQRQLEEAEDRLAKAKERLERRAAMREDVIRKRVAELLQPRDDADDDSAEDNDERAESTQRDEALELAESRRRRVTEAAADLASEEEEAELNELTEKIDEATRKLQFNRRRIEFFGDLEEIRGD